MKYTLRKKVKGIFIGLLVLVIITSIFVYYKFSTPSADIQQYKEYYVSKTTQKVVNQGEVKVTFLGTSSLLFDDGNTQLMIDGFISRPSLPKILFSKIKTDEDTVDKVFNRIGVDNNKLKGLFVAHTHYDHAFDLAYIAKRTGAHVYGSESTMNVGFGGGINEKQMSVYEVNKAMQFGDFTVTVLPSKHSPTFDEGEKVTKPLKQPAKALDYHEDSSYDFLIAHKNKAFLVKPSVNYIEGALDDIRADVLFLGTGVLGKQKRTFQNMYYEQTIRKVQPKLVIPIHWDDFNKPLTDTLEAMPKYADNAKNGLDFIIQRTKADKIDFQILQGFQSIYF
ncbi:MBL fold metallo-hydrolase [Bacillus sp. RC250]|uniref:MBL fold metallo-hydrolase n=1 Tax=Bacillus sp. RC250 TaxID=3156287 RepID=UPI003836D4FA